ncbi:MAG: hypothetical protein CMC08_02235 [Flavobacteriaceae bacterium]|nr:hypothetical protein [Flavobacteriaceae bacterium]
MYSSLHFNEGLEPFRIRALAFHQLKLRLGIAPHLEHYLVVRNPYDRLESFFKNKFRKNIHEREIERWEHCQRIFFPQMGLSNNVNYLENKAAFLKVTFEMFIKMLPLVYTHDAHLIPQSQSEVLKLPKGNFRIKYTSVYKMELPKHLEILAKNLEIDLGHPLNPTKPTDNVVQWTPELRKIVAKLYEDDFRNYGYKT